MPREHRSNARPSSRGKHEAGQARRSQDAGREKADLAGRREVYNPPRPQDPEPAGNADTLPTGKSGKQPKVIPKGKKRRQSPDDSG